MPVYAYRCRACGNQFETIQRITEKPLTHHHQHTGHKNFCGGSVYRVPQPVTIAFNGPGFYCTDSARPTEG